MSKLKSCPPTEKPSGCDKIFDSSNWYNEHNFEHLATNLVNLKWKTRLKCEFVCLFVFSSVYNVGITFGVSVCGCPREKDMGEDLEEKRASE